MLATKLIIELCQQNVSTVSNSEGHLHCGEGLHKVAGTTHTNIPEEILKQL